MALIVAPPREKNPYGSGIEELIKMYLMSSITGAMGAATTQASQDKSMLMEYGGEFTPEQAGALEQRLNPKAGGFQGLIEKLIRPKQKSIGFEQPAVQGPVELGINAPTSEETPQTGQSFFQSLLQPTERGTFKFPSRIERETKALADKARIEEEAKLPWRKEEEVSKSTRLAETLAEREKYHQGVKDTLISNMETRVKIAEANNDSREFIAGLKQQVDELKLTMSKSEAAWKEEVAKGNLAAKERDVTTREQALEKKGQMSEKENIKTFEDEMVARGFMGVDPKTKARTYKELDQLNQTQDLENLAKQYGYKVNWTEKTSAIMGDKSWVPSIDYSTARSEEKTGVIAEKPKGKPQKPTSRADVDALMKSANEAIKRGADPVAVRKRLKEIYGIDVK